MRATNQFEDYTQAPPSEQELIQRGEEIERQRARDEYRYRQRVTDSAVPTPEERAAIPEFRQRPPLPVIPAPARPHPALVVPCPQCKAQPGYSCRNHTGANCAPHTRRKSNADTAAQAEAEGQRQPPPPPAVEAARKREAEGGEYTDPLSDLAAQVEELIRTHHLGAVLDAAWEAQARLHPWQTKANTAGRV